MPTAEAEAPASSELIPLDKLTLDPRLQLREYEDEGTIEDYAENLLHMPPPKAVRETADDGTATHWVWDGFHTIKAAQRKGRASLRVEVTGGTFDDAFRAALGANTTHGRPLTIEDKAKKVRAALDNPKYQDKSARYLADLCGVSDHFVAGVRSAWEADRHARERDAAAGSNGAAPKKRGKKAAAKPRKLVGKDGKLRAARAKKSGKVRYNFQNYSKAVAAAERQLDKMYRAFGKLTDKGAIARDAEYKAIAEAFETAFKGGKARYAALAKEKPPEE